MLGIIGAMKAEVAQLKQEMNQPEVVTVAGMEFYRGTIGEKEVVVVQSGIGKVSAALCVQILADRFGVDGVVNTGIAGSLKAEINIGDLVLSTDAIQHDVGYAPLALRSFFVPLANFGSRLAIPLILIGFIFSGGGSTLVTLGILFFSLSVVFTIITLPVEFNASRRAIRLLADDGFLDSDEIGGAKKVLSAAAMTYVAAAFAAIAQLLRLVAIFGRRND